MVIIHFTCPQAIITKYVVVIILNKLLSIRSIRNRKIRHFTFAYPSLIFFLSSCRFEFLICIICFLLEEFLLILLAGQIQWQHSLNFCLFEKVFLLHFFLNIKNAMFSKTLFFSSYRFKAKLRWRKKIPTFPKYSVHTCITSPTVNISC